MSKELVKLKDELLAGRSVLTFTSGVSMEPLLHDKKKKNATHVLIVPARDRCSVGDMPLALLPDGRYIIHRIIRIDEKEGKAIYVTRGDNCIGCEYIPQEAVFGVVKEVYYKNKTVKVTDRGYLFYVKTWTKLYPVRRIWMKVRGILARIYHKLKRSMQK